MAKEMKVVNHGASTINLRHLGTDIIQMMPSELHYKTNGSTSDGPSFAMVLQGPIGIYVVGQFTLDTLQECLGELGYEIKEKEV